MDFSLLSSVSSHHAPSLGYHYHERQWLYICAVHTLNNLFQERWISRHTLDEIAFTLFDKEKELARNSGIQPPHLNPFKSVVPLFGDYDINVITAALESRCHRISDHVVFNIAHPERCKQELACVNLTACRGVIINFEDKGILWNSRHWFAILKQEDGTFYNCDSKLRHPELIGKGESLIAWVLERLMNGTRLQAFFVAPIQEEEWQYSHVIQVYTHVYTYMYVYHTV